jgi:hypothetical protein
MPRCMAVSRPMGRTRAERTSSEMVAGTTGLHDVPRNVMQCGCRPPGQLARATSASRSAWSATCSHARCTPECSTREHVSPRRGRGSSRHRPMSPATGIKDQRGAGKCQIRSSSAAYSVGALRSSTGRSKGTVLTVSPDSRPSLHQASRCVGFLSASRAAAGTQSPPSATLQAGPARWRPVRA